MIIGIPRALIYWKKPFFWEVFFEKLGFSVLLSPTTNKEIVSLGTEVADPESCFSTKVYFGHVLWLENKCDYIFVPRLKADKEKLEYCPKFFGLPDLAKIIVKTPILTENFDERREKFIFSIEKLGRKLKKSKKEVEEARKAAELMEEKNIKEYFKKEQSEKPTIVLISHPYNLHDEYVNLRLKEKLEKLGVEVVFIDEMQMACCNLKDLAWPKFHWEFGREMMKGISHILDCKVAGVIEVSSLACGCDAVLKEFIEKTIKENKIPFLYLIIDEHTGEAGLQTRLEAFIDTLK